VASRRQYAAAVIGIVAVMAGTFGAGESLTIDLNDGILVRVALTPLSPYRIVFEILAVNAVLDLLQLLPALAIVFLLHPVPLVWVLAATVAVFATLVTANCIGIFIANFHLFSGGCAPVRDGDPVPSDLRLRLLPQPEPRPA
jgi:ABC-2 type transport system permease protein